MEKVNMCECKCEDENRLEKKYVEYLRDKPKINTSQLYETLNIPRRFECSYLFTGYGYQQDNTHPFYRTVNSEYGYYAPNPHTVPTRYFPRSQRFTTALAKAGMFRNFSLNTNLDKPYLH